MNAQIDELVSFYTERSPAEWFNPPEGFDDQLRSKYGDLVRRARTTELDSLADTPKGALAMIILLDQIPRNIFRGSGESFSSDAKALDITTRAIARKFDRELGKQNRGQQYLFVMPLMHAENLLAQITAISFIENLLKDCPDDDKIKESLAQGLPFSWMHLECIRKLGRFPKRNAAMGRTTTEEEKKFLEEHPQGF